MKGWIGMGILLIVAMVGVIVIAGFSMATSSDNKIAVTRIDLASAGDNTVSAVVASVSTATDTLNESSLQVSAASSDQSADICDKPLAKDCDLRNKEDCLGAGCSWDDSLVGGYCFPYPLQCGSFFTKNECEKVSMCFYEGGKRLCYACNWESEYNVCSTWDPCREGGST